MLNATEYAEVVNKVGAPWYARGKLDADKITELRSHGFSMNQIGKYFEVSRSTVYRALKRDRMGKDLSLKLLEI
jgi:DNA invertase Pin-like site-specific DNA recombinase